MYVIGDDIGTSCAPTMKYRGNCRCAYPYVRIDYEIASFRKRQNKSLNELNRELAWMRRLFNVIMLHVWYNPNIAWVLT